MQIKDLKMTCGACPTQWEARTADGHEQHVHIRYHWGTLSLSLDHVVCMMIDHGDPYDSVISLDKMLELLNLEVV